jgi:hypothetical protein
MPVRSTILAMRLLRVAGIAALVAAAGLAGLATAHVVKYPTGSLNIDYTNSDEGADEQDYFSGRIEANKRSCFQNRRVAVIGDVPGVDIEVGSDRTTSTGEWKVFGEDVAAGGYYAEADRKTRKLTVDHRHVCRAVRSNSIQAGP